MFLLLFFCHLVCFVSFCFCFVFHLWFDFVLFLVCVLILFYFFIYVLVLFCFFPFAFLFCFVLVSFYNFFLVLFFFLRGEGWAGGEGGRGASEPVCGYTELRFCDNKLRYVKNRSLLGVYLN